MTLYDFAEIVGKRFYVDAESILGPDRYKLFVHPRHVLMTALWLNGVSQARIARLLNRDQTTVGTAIKNMREVMEFDKRLAKIVDEMRVECVPLAYPLAVEDAKMRREKSLQNLALVDRNPAKELQAAN